MIMLMLFLVIDSITSVYTLNTSSKSKFIGWKQPGGLIFLFYFAIVEERLVVGRALGQRGLDQRDPRAIHSEF